jgi:hypothetical protein
MGFDSNLCGFGFSLKYSLVKNQGLHHKSLTSFIGISIVEVQQAVRFCLSWFITRIRNVLSQKKAIKKKGPQSFLVK